MCKPISNLRINAIVEESIVDGPGIRYTIFVQGCPHRCKDCFNPQTHTFNSGYEVDTDYLFSKINKNLLITGVTFSGGEPMCQARGLSVLAEKINSIGLELAIYTGYTLEQLLKERNKDRHKLLTLCDVLIDGRFKVTEHSLALRFRGSSNQRILDAKQSLKFKTPIFIANDNWI